MKIFQIFILVVAAFILVAGSVIIIMLPGLHVMEMLVFAGVVLTATTILYNATKLLEKIGRQYTTPYIIPAKQPKSATALVGKHSIFRSKPPVRDMNKMLYMVESVWPFHLFPCRLTVEEGGITIIRTTFFKVASTETILTKDIFNIVLNTGPIFASMDVQRRTSIEGSSQVIEVSYLPKHKALIAKQIIDGLLLEQAKTISVPKHLPPELRREMLMVGGRNRQVEHDVTT